MKQLFRLLGRRAWLWLVLPSFAALGQTTTTPVPTADTFIRPYTETFQFGTNSGYYGTSWTDDDLAGIAQKAGVHTLRPTLPESFVESFGYDIREATFSAYVNKLGMKEITCFIGGPAAWHADFTTYPGCTQSSKLFGHLYDPIWNADGTVNASNLYAIYVYKLLQTYGNQVRFWEVVNEPDFTNGADASAWLTRAPTPAEQLNTQAPFYHYVRMLRITYEVVKKYHPEAYVSTGGIGNPEYADALLRYTDEPTAGAVTAAYPRTGGAYFDVLSFHAYPNYALHYWDNSIGGFRYTRTSDYAATRVIQYKNEMGGVLAKYGYDGTKHPTKLYVLTESNVSRRTSDDRIGSDEQQRNFNIKNLVLLQKNGVTQFYTYAIGEAVDAPAATQSVSGGDELGLMGIYQNLYTATPATVKLTMAGQAFLSTSKLLYGYAYDPARTAALALPSAVEGAAFSKAGSYIYVLWAKALVDNVEQATATYSFPAALNLATVNRYEWDYSLTNTNTTQAAQNVALSTVPSFFVAGSAAPVSCTATGTILREQWDNVSGSTVASVPVATTPTSTSQLPQLEFNTTNGFNYAARVRGYLCAPQSGAYTFSLTSDDDGELWLSPDTDPTHKVRIATCGGWTSDIHDYTRYANQKSAAVTLVAGQSYYLEVLHKQSWGPGYASVAMTLPGGTTEAPLAGSHLSPFVGTTPPVVVVPPVTPPTGGCSATGSILREQWDNVNGSLVASVPVAATPTSTSQLPQFEATGTAFNYGARVRGYVCVPLSGAYNFSLTSDDDGELWLSPDADPTHKARIATCQGWLSGIHDYTRYAGQQSAAITLVAGQKYYIEALHKQSWGPGFVSVAWTLPNGTTEAPLSGTRLSPYVPAVTVAALAGPPATASAVGSLTTDAATTRAASPATQLAAYPNPFTQQTTVQFGAATAGHLSLAVYNVEGQLVRQLFVGEGQAGASQSVTLDRQNLSSGLYLLRLVTGSSVVTQKLTLN